jgi:predicted Zn-dependent peptidase
VTPEQVRAAVAPLAFPAGPPLTDAGPLPVQDGMRLSFQRADGSPQTEVRLSFRGPGEADPRFAQLSVLADLLDGGPTGRLPERLVDSGLAYTARAELLNLPDVSLLELDVTCAHDKVPRAVASVLDMLTTLLVDGVFPEELERGRLRRRHLRRAVKDDVAGQAEDAVRRLIFGLEADPGPLLAREDAVNGDALVSLAAELFAPEQLSAVFFGDLGKKRSRRVKAILDQWRR